MEVDVAGRRHDDPARLERPPFAADEPYPVVVDGVAEDRTGELDLAGCQVAGAFHRLAELGAHVRRLPQWRPRAARAAQNLNGGKST